MVETEKLTSVFFFLHILLLQMEDVHIKFHILTFFYEFILIYRLNIGKRAILNKNIGIRGLFLKDRDFIGNIGMLEDL